MTNNQFNCPTCGGNFQSNEELNSHAQQVHGKNERQQEEHAITCSKCGFKAKSTQDLTSHEQQHGM